jgi:hypothetical protein
MCLAIVALHVCPSGFHGFPFVDDSVNVNDSVRLNSKATYKLVLQVTQKLGNPFRCCFLLCRHSLISPSEVYQILKTSELERLISTIVSLLSHNWQASLTACNAE